MSRLFEVQRDDLIVDPQIFQCQIGEGWQPFIAGTDSLKLTKARSWTFHLAATLLLVALFAFLNRALFAWKWDWADNGAVFAVFVLSPILAFNWAIYTFYAFREHSSPDKPSHLIAGTVTKRKVNIKNGTRTVNVEYPLPDGGIGKTKGLELGVMSSKGSRVAVLHYDHRKASVLL